MVRRARPRHLRTRLYWDFDAALVILLAKRLQRIVVAKALAAFVASQNCSLFILEFYDNLHVPVHIVYVCCREPSWTDGFARWYSFGTGGCCNVQEPTHKQYELEHCCTQSWKSLCTKRNSTPMWCDVITVCKTGHINSIFFGLISWRGLHPSWSDLRWWVNICSFKAALKSCRSWNNCGVQ